MSDGKEKPFRWTSFLKDVFVCSLGAYGGPEAHFGVFLDQMVVRRRYLSEDDLVELLALCSVLPGPTSTQTIVAIGHKMGGPVLALLTMLVWGFPAVAVMIALSFLYQILEAYDVSRDLLRYLGPMAVGFIVVAAWRIGRKVVKDGETALLMLGGALSAYWIRAPWIYPAVLILGGAVSIALGRERGMWNRTRLSPPWGYGVAFAVLAFGLLALGTATSWWWAELFERFYRYGYLVFGGGQVVVPLMHGELVVEHGFMTDSEFLTGYGLVQGLPGPMFSFAAYAGGMAERGGTGGVGERGRQGGSGGGGGAQENPNVWAGGFPVAGQGHAGGQGVGNEAGGGGGGAGGPGGDAANPNIGGDGGPAVFLKITDTVKPYGAGGGGGQTKNGTPGVGGSEVGGDGATRSKPGSPGAVNTGSGGGGGGGDGALGGQGGSGIVIVRYVIPPRGTVITLR